jgi:hypothetical protein
MTADAVNLLREIRRAGGDVRLVGCNRLKLVAPITLLAELAERVRAAKPMLLAVLADNTTPVQGDGEGVSYPSSNRATLQHSLAESSPDPTMPIPAADWCARYREALAYWSGFHAPSEAARLAWARWRTDGTRLTASASRRISAPGVES